MIESIDVRLREIGISDTDVQNRLDGKDKALVVTDHDVVYVDSSGVQRSTLRFVTKVITDKTGSLTIRSSSGPAIEGSIRGFDVTELKVFFEGVKSSIARAKTASGATQGEAQSAAQHANEADASAQRSSEPQVDHSVPVHPVPMHPVPMHSVPDHSASDRAALNPDDALDHSPQAQHDHDAHPEPLDGFPSISTPAPAMDPWESLSTPRPTLEMPAAPGVLSGFSEDFVTRTGFGTASPDPLDWDEPALDTSISQSARITNPDHLELLDPDTLATPDMPVMPAIPAQNAAGADLTHPSASDQSLSLNQPGFLDSATPTLAEQYAISPVSRWLKILAIPLGLLGIAAGALSVPATETTSIVPWLQVGGFIIGGASAALISYGIGDLLAIWSSMASDIRAVRRNQNH
jgi:hypothetical protein